MSQAVMEVFDAPIQKTMSWMDELTQMLGWEDPRKTYSVMRVVLHSLRDRLTVQEAAHLGSQLPMLIRGFYYEGWDPDKKPIKLKTKEEFLNHLCGKFPRGCDFDSEKAVQSVFKLLADKIAKGEIEDIRQNIPKDLAEWWPED